MSIEITIDNHKILAKPEQTILDVANENSIHIPTLCNHPNLKPTGACRICVVDIGRADRLEAACTTPVSPKMTVFTANERVKRASDPDAAVPSVIAVPAVLGRSVTPALPVTVPVSVISSACSVTLR